MHRNIPPACADPAAEAHVWADILLRRRLLHAAVLGPTGQWLVQRTPTAPVRLLDGPAEMIRLAAHIQYRLRTEETRAR
ncbi:hypothetical protein [Streptomyces uncialis]|uniref:hypothetical protein n=1 Tax=Streptomyces uncialis TaxID=1048205 RepID=UPI002253C88E|nr:hypothetical protein [Streptomyces uncialis]MCX4659150.1 hypothetical protein [Streptomyces uncialis]